ncbi:phosphoglycerate kinase [Haematobacter massiliensis]|uniref:Phosphoglycerate kinase n=1 Tax=Haematobacter massiliensis TaxID=195105 RepID=A0A086YCW0_9RHOB|nr:phosphoglycerate kinase [Haematobacter massiliensis]KFI32110.1 phosphoglycerate kinase [Haematobacter massiliensis]OWJ72708.1 phosphoglycerate kinase [Haematobacter massiliensis]OWJ85752.1 phosphoglycerate kinase [Haematobacter massiliensis]QBJ24492.1 phosphoglycerate kinase [Haematobacter massiliensis]
MAWKTLDDFDLKDKRVLIRVDVNVPVADGKVTDATRIEKIAPTIHSVLEKGGRPILLAHFDRPKGKVVPSMSLRVVVPAMEKAFGTKVVFAEDCTGSRAEEAIEQARPGEVVLLENTRFHAGEEQNDPAFARQLAELGDVYINDAFSVSHRAHASVEAITKLLPSGAGRQMEAELNALAAALGDPKRPLVAIVGGAKVSTKLDLLGNLVTKVDHLVIGGGMANTFLVAQGKQIGKSLAEPDMAETARDILARAKAANCSIHLPVDIVVAREFKANAPHEILPADDCPSDAMILDAGPQTVKELEKVFDACRTLIWNGPLGAFELEPFDRATTEAARHAAKLTQAGRLVSVAGGGDTVAALNKAGVAGDFTYISTAGGAFLEWMEGKELPGVKALDMV